MSPNHPSGAVGTESIACLEERNFPLRSRRLFASERSAGQVLAFRGDGGTAGVHRRLSGRPRFQADGFASPLRV
jgi:aspartate-semialdehyde dehydrogenase